MSRSHRLLDLVGSSALCAAALCSSPVSAQAASRDLLLEVFINGVDTEKVASFVERDGQLYAAPDELKELGFMTGSATARRDLVALASMPGVETFVDERSQSVQLTVPVSALAAHAIGRGDGVGTGAATATPLGLLINYDVTAIGDGGEVDLFGLTSTRVFARFGTIQNDATITRYRSGARIVRLGTTYSYSDPDSLRTYSVGDLVSGSLASSRSIRLAGVQVATNFALRPDLITYPLPVVSGGAAVPSTVDVLVNGVRQLSTPVAPGPFYVPQLPVVTGAGQISVAVRDAAGRQTLQTSSFYASPELLRPGLSSFSLEAGAVRRDFGVESADYGAFAASGTGRLGVSPSLTIEGHAEAGGRIGMASGGFAAEIARFAVVSGSLSGSSSPDGAGGQLYASAERTTRSYHLGLSASLATPGFRDVGALAGDRPPRHVIQANAGMTFGRQGSLGVAYVDVIQPAVDGATNGPDPLRGGGVQLRPAIRSSVATATYSRELFGRVYAYVTGYDDLRSRRGAVMGGFSLRFGGRGSVNASYESATHRAVLEASRPALDPGQVGWRVYAAHGSTDRALGEVRYRASNADIGVGIDTYGGRTFVQANARGSLALVSGSLFAANTISDGFAVVDTGKAGRVRVSLNNRPVGSTNSAGKLLVPGLIAYQPNRIAIDPTDLPLDASWSRTEALVATGDRMGALARFDVKRRRAVLLAIRSADGAYLALGARLTLADGRSTDVGFDGQAYVEDAPSDIDGVVELPDGGRCRVAAALPSTGGAMSSGLNVACLPLRLVASEALIASRVK